MTKVDHGSQAFKAGICDDGVPVKVEDGISIGADTLRNVNQVLQGERGQDRIRLHAQLFNSVISSNRTN